MTRTIPGLAAASILALAAAACGDNAAPAPDAAPPVTPPPVADSTTARLTPQGWGPLRIGMTRAEVVAALGEDANPNAVGGADPEQCDEFRPQRAPEAMLLMLESGILTRISLIRPSDIVTEQGFGVGDAGDGIKNVLGGSAFVEPHKYESAPSEYITVWSVGGGADYVEDPNARGLVFEVGQDGAVKAIRAGGPSIQYVEGCS